ncbi:CoA transferase [Chromobacterium haemolyticum]|nr:CoA transferase [Chromobacterium haemolyticum]
MTTLNGQQALAQLWAAAALDPSALERAQLPTGPAPLPSSFAVGALAQASIAASALMAAEFWRLRGGAAQTVTVDLAHAAAEFRSERYLRVDGAPAPELWDAIAGPYRCGDGRWVRIHTNFPHHRDGILCLLDCRHDNKDSVAAALQGWRAFEFEQAVAERGLVATAMRSFDEWDRHPQGQAVAALPLFDIERIGDAPPLARPFAPRPLQGIRVLDLTRIIAGPVGGRVLAAHGADVLRVTSPRLPSIPPLDIDTGRGKRNAELDLRQAADGEQLRRLLAEADVFIQGYRPGGGLAALGFGPEQAARACVRASSTPRCPPMATPAPGPGGAASTPWFRPPAASITPRRRLSTTTSGRARCRLRRWTMPPAICWLSASSPRLPANRKKAAVGRLGFH